MYASISVYFVVVFNLHFSHNNQLFTYLDIVTANLISFQFIVDKKAHIFFPTKAQGHLRAVKMKKAISLYLRK